MCIYAHRINSAPSTLGALNLIKPLRIIQILHLIQGIEFRVENMNSIFANKLNIFMKSAYDRYFFCLESCHNHEQIETPKRICLSAL